MSNYRRTQIGNVLTLLIPKRLLRFVTDNRICAETIFILKLKNSQLSHRSKDTVDIFIVIIFAPFEMVSMHERILKISNGLPPATVSEDLSCRAIHFVHILRGTSYTTIVATRIPISWRQEITAHPLVGAEAIPNICSIIGIVSNSNRIALVQRSIGGRRSRWVPTHIDTISVAEGSRILSQTKTKFCRRIAKILVLNKCRNSVIYKSCPSCIASNNVDLSFFRNGAQTAGTHIFLSTNINASTISTPNITVCHKNHLSFINCYIRLWWPPFPFAIRVCF